MDYSKALSNLNPILRRRLHTIADLADMTELEALEIIVETTKDSTESDSRLAVTENRR